MLADFVVVVLSAETTLPMPFIDETEKYTRNRRNIVVVVMLRKPSTREVGSKFC